jgi:hypothetical protein
MKYNNEARQQKYNLRPEDKDKYAKNKKKLQEIVCHIIPQTLKQ